MGWDRDGNWFEDDDPPDTWSGLPGDMGSTPDLNDGVFNGTVAPASSPNFDPSGFHEAEDIATWRNKNPEDRAAYEQALNEKQTRRLASTSDRHYDSQGPAFNRTTNQLNPGFDPRGAAFNRSPPAAPVFGQTAGGGAGPGGGGGENGGLFDDPASSLVESYALDQFGRRVNPNPNSGTALFEQYARELMDTLRQPVYSAQDEALLKGKALDGISREEASTLQLWMEEVSRRGMSPSSGPALDGILKIKESFNQARNAFETQFATNAIERTRQQRVERLGTAGQLAMSEEARLREAGTYAAVPLELQNQAFKRNLSLVNAGGTPQSVVQSSVARAQVGQAADNARNQYALSMAQMAQNAETQRQQNAIEAARFNAQLDAYNSAGQQQLMAELFRAAGYAFGG